MLIQTHPRKEIREELNEWIVTGKVWLSFESNLMPPVMAIELVGIKGRYVPTLVTNPLFLSTSTHISEVDRKYKYLVLRHEYQHLHDHFTGIVPLRRMQVGPSETIEDRAEHVWVSEFRATRAEWEFAKELKAEFLMPTIEKAVWEQGEQGGFLEAFYNMLTGSAIHVSHPEKFLSVWKNIFRREKERLK